MIRLAGLHLAMLAAIALLLPAGAAHAGALAECDDRAGDAEATPREITRCYYLAARKGADWETVRARLTGLREQPQLQYWATLTLAHMASDHGHDEAEALYRTAVEGFAASGDALGETYASIGLATLFSYANRFDEAHAALDRGEEAAARLDDPYPLASVRAQRARQWHHQGEHERAIALLEEVEQAVFPDGPYQLKMLTLHVLAGSHFESGRTERAYPLYERLVALATAEGDLYVASTGLLNQASLLANDPALEQQQEPGELERVARAALEAAQQGGNRFSEAGAECTLGAALGTAGISHLERCVAMYDEFGYLDYYPDMLGMLALATFPSDPEGGFQMLEEAALRARRGEAHEALINILVTRAWMRWESGDRERALAESLEMLDAIESVSDQQRAELARVWVRAFWAVPYYDTAGRVALAGDGPGDLEQAFAIMERLRGRTLVEAMARSELAALESVAPVRAGYREALDEVSRIQREMRDGGEVDRARLQAELQSAEAEVVLRSEALARAEAELPGVGSLELPTAAQVQQQLRDDEAMVLYQLPRVVPGVRFVAPEYSTPGWALVLTRDTAVVVPLDGADELGAAADRYRDLVALRDGSEAPFEELLYRGAVTPVREAMPDHVTRWVVVPDGALFRVPLGELGGGGGQPRLADCCPLTIVPSATLWLQLRQATSTAGGDVLVLADPALEHQDGQVALLRHVPDWDLALRGELGALPRARQEAKVATRAGGPGSLARVGEQATEAVLELELPPAAGVIHLAAHAVVDEQRPERSAVILAPGGPEDDGLLQVREVAELQLHGRVVVLSACASATGTVLRGEGVVGLSRAFFQAGATTVVATLWPMRDEDASRFFQRFYRHLGRGESVEEAVRATQVELAGQGLPAEAWAGVVVLGDGSVAPLTPRPWWMQRQTWVFAILVLLVTPLATWAVRRLALDPARPRTPSSLR